jgi:secreted trypsin-like serine protease
MMRRGGSWRGRAAIAAVFCTTLTVGLAPAAAPAAPVAQTSIIGGKAAPILAFPSLAYIAAGVSPHHGFACSGTVIAPRLILTAAHCVEDLETGGFTPADRYAVATGFADPREAGPENIFRVTSTHVFPEFDPGTLRGDAGILILATPTTAPAIALPTATDSALYEGGETVLLSGWGLTRAGTSVPPKRLRSAPTVVQDAQSCKRRTRDFLPSYSPAFQLCTLDPPADKTGGCFGDSGGPAIAQRPDGAAVEIGITSTGGPSCSTRLPTVLTRTDRVSVWATEWIAASEYGAPPPKPTAAQTRLPPLSTESAEGLVVRALANAFGNRFRLANDLRGRCERVEREKVRCGLAWGYGPRLYYGTATVYLVSRRDAVAWDSRYGISWVNNRCRLAGDPKRPCAVHTRHG